MTAKQAYNELTESLRSIYDAGESGSIARWVVENITGRQRVFWPAEDPLSPAQIKLLQDYKNDLTQGKPVQYVLNEAFFCGNRFVLNEAVLIPRPETEELTKLVAEENRSRVAPRLLEVGSGSGCIAITLKKKLPDAEVHSIDISEEAISVARLNAENLSAEVNFQVADFLNESGWANLGTFDIIISNPPYIPLAEKDAMDKNVVDFEPAVALFVPDDDPFIFYRKIERFCRTGLNAKGSVYLEVHENYAQQALDIFPPDLYNARVVRDMYEKQRMIVLEKKATG